MQKYFHLNIYLYHHICVIQFRILEPIDWSNVFFIITSIELSVMSGFDAQ